MCVCVRVYVCASVGSEYEVKMNMSSGLTDREDKVEACVCASE